MKTCFSYCVLIILIEWTFAAELKETSEWDIIRLISHHEYPIEIHEIVTIDGYLLDIFRIPYGRKSKDKKINEYPVVMMHGLLVSAEAFLFTGPAKALAYTLADNGYDVWICNARGTKHSKKHKTMDPDKDKEFWQFSWHEIGVYDLPATIDYVLKVTHKRKLHYVGHSQGSTTFFVMASERPEYNEKVKVMVALAPSALLGHFSQPVLKLLVPFSSIIQKLLTALNMQDVSSMISSDTLYEGIELLKTLCRPENNFRYLCKLLYSMFELDEQQFFWSNQELIIDSLSAGASIRQIDHYSQLAATGKFQKYDWGVEENMRRYGQKTPQTYNLRNITAPVALFYGENDHFVDPRDVLELAKQLPNVIELYKVPYKLWTHFDFLLAKDMDILLNSKVLEVMKKFNDL